MLQNMNQIEWNEFDSNNSIVPSIVTFVKSDLQRFISSKTWKIEHFWIFTFLSTTNFAGKTKFCPKFARKFPILSRKYHKTGTKILIRMTVFGWLAWMRNWSVRSSSHYIALLMPDPTWILYNHKIQNFCSQSENYYFVQTLLIYVWWRKWWIFRIVRWDRVEKIQNFSVKIPNFDMKCENFCSKKA